MKKSTFWCVVWSFVLSPIFLAAQTPNTIAIDGNNSGWKDSEKFLDISTADTLYFTWDDNFIYLGIYDAEADYDNMSTSIFIDTDVNGANGDMLAYPMTGDIDLPFKADFGIHFLNGADIWGTYIRIDQWIGGGWSYEEFWYTQSVNVDDFEFAIGTDYRECRIKRSFIGNPDKIKIATVTEQQWGSWWRYFAWPNADWTDNTYDVARVMTHYYGFELINGVDPDDAANYDRDFPFDPPGNALDFDGSNDYVQIPNSVSITPGNEMTFEAWVKIPVNQMGNIVMKGDYGWGILIGSDGCNPGNRLNYWVNSACTSSLPSSGTIPVGVWTHVAVVVTTSPSKSLTFYINGEEAGSSTDPSISINNGSNGDLILGRQGTTCACNYFNGQMDEVRLWNDVRTPVEIQGNMFNLVDPAAAGLVAYYQFDEASGTSLPDHTANGNNGTLTNMDEGTDWVESYAMVVPVAEDATAVSGGTFQANWTAPAVGDVESYYLEVANDAAFTSKLIGYDPYKDMSTATSEVLSDLPAGQYYYRLRAFKAITGNTGAYSAVKNVTIEPPPPGNALDFDGSNDYVETTPMITFNTSFTISSWIKTTNDGVVFCWGQAGAGKFTALRVYFGKLRLVVGDGVEDRIDGNILVNDGRWHHVAAVKNGNAIELFVDGVSDVTGSSARVTVPTISTIGGGFINGSYMGFFTGQIDEVCVWDIPRSQAEIQANMFDIINPASAGLVAYYRFDESNPATTLPDYTSNGFDGVLTNMDPASDWTESYAMVVPALNNATNITAYTCDIDWNAPVVGDVENYYLEVATDAAFTSKIAGYDPYKAMGIGLSEALTGLEENTTYYYRVRAFKASTGDVGAFSEVKSVKTAIDPPGNALDFDGTDDFVDCGSLINTNFIDNSTTLTVEAWINMDDILTESEIVSNSTTGVPSGFELRVVNKHVFMTYRDNNGTQYGFGGGHEIVAGRWCHVAGVITNTGEIITYYNGTPSTPMPCAANGIMPSANSFKIGGNTGGFRVNGRIDEVRIWDDVRTPAEIQGNMYNTIDPATSGLVAYYRFDEENPQTTLPDLSGNGNDGTLTNMDPATDWIESYAMVCPVNENPTTLLSDGFTANWLAPEVGEVDAYYLEVDDNADFSSLISGYDPKDCGLNLSTAVTGLGQATKYYYRVRAFKSSVGDVGGFHYSAPKSVTTKYAPPGNALDFDGVNDLVSSDPFTPQTNNITMELWVKWDGTSTGASQVIINNGHTSLSGYGLLLSSGDNDEVALLCGAVAIANTDFKLPVDKWCHLALVRDNGIWKLYADGTEVALSGNPAPNAIPPSHFGVIGGNLGGEPFSGMIDEVRIWTIARTQTEIISTMNDTVDKNSTGLVAYYNFDSPSGTPILEDVTSNTTDGTLTNMDPPTDWVESYAMVYPGLAPATGVNCHELTINWTAPKVGVVDNYYLEVATDDAFTSKLAAYNPFKDIGSSLSETITGLSPGEYFYRVRAFKTSTDDVGAIIEKGSVQTDVTAPTAVCKDITVYLNGSGTATISANDIDNGSTDDCGIETRIASLTSFNCGDIGDASVDLIVIDSVGLSDTCTATVTVADTTRPTVVCRDMTLFLNAAGTLNLVPGMADDGSSDACGIASMSLDVTSVNCTNVGANTVTLFVTDNNGNSASCQSTFTIKDSIKPTVSCKNLTVYLDATGNATITANDLDNGSTDACGIATLEADVTSFNCSNLGDNTVTLSVTDVNDNVRSCQSTVTVKDTTSPVAVAQDITVYLSGTGTATITGSDIDGGSTDNCSVDVLLATPATFDGSDIGANTVTLTVTDGEGNSKQATATVTVADTTSPTAVCQNITVYLDGSGNASIVAADVDGGSTDNCGSVTLGIDVSAFTCSNIGANTVILTVTDGAANTKTCQATVTVADTTSPTTVCQNLTVYLDGSGNASIVAADVDGGSTDICGSVSLGIDVSAFTCTNIGDNTVTLTATDGQGNSKSCQATVTVIDTVSPVAVCQDISVDVTLSSSATITGGDLDDGSTDACGISTLVPDVTDFTCANAGENTVILTVTDPNGNSNTCSSTVTVSDVTVPTMTVMVICQNDSILSGSVWYHVGETYFVTLIAANGCDSVVAVMLNAPANVIGTTTPTMVSVWNGSDGEISLNINGGLGTYTVSWSCPNGFTADTTELEGLFAGMYHYTITDSCGTMIQDSVEITQPDYCVDDLYTWGCTDTDDIGVFE
ncbi:MAG: hypothetical protein KKA07_01515, partial [Bacteroidetes bacterium]|nr:hypothetical protein [Bacteroidota bacterium]